MGMPRLLRIVSHMRNSCRAVGRSENPGNQDFDFFLLLNLHHFLLLFYCCKKTYQTALLFNHIYFQHGRFSYIIDQFDHQNIYKILGAILV